MNEHRRSVLTMAGGLASAGLFGGAAHAIQAAGQLVFRPETFGARGDGVSNDTAAFARLAETVNANGGGRIELRRTTYIVGGHQPGTGNRNPTLFDPQKVMNFYGCRKPLTISGNGARLRCASGMRYGVFESLAAPWRRSLLITVPASRRRIIK